jgi:Uma2 family endonuclease
MSMSTRALISEEEYLHRVYEPDCEYEDGVLIERNVGERDHSWLQLALGAYFFRRRKVWDIHAFTEQRYQIRKDKYMIPDICVISGSWPTEKIFDKPPLLWIEILSPEDRPIRINEKIRQLLEFGATNIWVIDPETLESELHTRSGSRSIEDGVMRIEGTPIEVPLHKIDED